MNKKRLPVGISSFKQMIEENYMYIDKTLFIKEIIDKGAAVLLIPRPRRFGKTLNLSMLRYFYDCCPENTTRDSDAMCCQDADQLPGNSYKELFQNLEISRAGQEYLDKMGKHPVIFLSFRDIKELDWETAYRKTQKLVREEYARHNYLQFSDILMPHEKDYFRNIINLRGNREDFEDSLGKLLLFLNKYHKKRVVILIDEYDAPIHAGFTHNYYDEVINFTWNFLSRALKDTDEYLEKSVITGILSIANNSIYSGFNNYGVYTLTADEFSDKFGFTEKEVENLLKDFDILDSYDDVKTWYNGYKFGNETIYNPWSIINWIESENHELQPYWLNTAGNELIESMLSNGGTELKTELEQLIRGESIEKVIDENIVMKEIASRENLLWSFLLMTGYLKYTSKRRETYSYKLYHTLSIPNQEVRTAYLKMIENYFGQKIKNKKIESMLKALIDGDIVLFEGLLREIVTGIFSYHDFSGEPEKVYHALVMGLLVWITDSHEIKSNRESGYGRYDIVIIPRNPSQIGYIIEFKAVLKNLSETVSTAVESALRQIEEKKYETELIERGISQIKKLAIVFSVKEVVVKERE